MAVSYNHRLRFERMTAESAGRAKGVNIAVTDHRMYARLRRRWFEEHLKIARQEVGYGRCSLNIDRMVSTNLMELIKQHMSSAKDKDCSN